jgi:hypothetical protein
MAADASVPTHDGMIAGPASDAEHFVIVGFALRTGHARLAAAFRAGIDPGLIAHRPALNRCHSRNGAKAYQSPRRHHSARSLRISPTG